MKTKICLFIASVIILSLTLPAHAELITIAIEATVDTVEDYGNYLEGQISPGSIITGYYTYESTTADSSPADPVVGRYEYFTPPHGVFLSVGGFDFQTNLSSVDFLIGIGNTSNHDIYWLHSYNNLPLSNGTLVDHISWQLDDYTGSAFSSDVLLTTAPVLSDWQFNHLRIYGDRTFLIDAHVTSAVPEPLTILLLGIGGLVLARTNRQQKTLVFGHELLYNSV